MCLIVVALGAVSTAILLALTQTLSSVQQLTSGGSVQTRLQLGQLPHQPERVVDDGEVLCPGGRRVAQPTQVPPIEDFGLYLLRDRDRRYSEVDVYAFLHPLHTATNLEGKYRIDGVPVGKMKVNARHPRIDFEQTVDIEVKPAVIHKIDFVIEYSTPEALERSIERWGISVLWVAPGNAKNLAGITAVSQARGVTTTTGVPDYVLSDTVIVTSSGGELLTTTRRGPIVID